MPDLPRMCRLAFPLSAMLKRLEACVSAVHRHPDLQNHESKQTPVLRKSHRLGSSRTALENRLRQQVKRKSQGIASCALRPFHLSFQTPAISKTTFHNFGFGAAYQLPQVLGNQESSFPLSYNNKFKREKHFF